MNDELLKAETGSGKKTSYLTPVLIVLAVIYVGFLLYQAVYINYATNQKIKNLRTSLKNAQTDKDRLELLINYYKTSTFQELEARKKLGLKMPGEVVVKVEVPKAQASTSSVKLPAEQIVDKQNNPQLWLDYLSGKDRE